jgi:signal transduction histidine kinase
VDQGDLAVSFAHLVRDDLSCGVLVFNPAQRLLFCSPNVARLLGLQTPPAIGASAAGYPACVKSLLDRASRQNHRSSDTEFFHRAGSPDQSLRLSAIPLHGQSGEVTAILVQDIGFADRLECDIRQLDRLASVGTLAAEMAHEVRNAMVAVKTFVDLLVEKNPDADLAATVSREMTRVDSIVAQVLKYSRNAAPVIKPTSAHALINHALGMVKSRLGGRNISVETRLAAAPDSIHGDENHLHQAILNVLINASEAMGSDGTLSIETEFIAGPDHNGAEYVSQRQVRILVRDSGPGIPSETMAHLFEPFFTTKTNGTGLGLAITRRIIHEHHGLISAESEPGRGATFQIMLPAA